MTVNEAIDIVARQVIAAAQEADWEDYPEIGENDWLAVEARIAELAPYSPDFHDAYDLLEERAEK